MLDFFFPKFCLICGSPGSYLCRECLLHRLVYINQQFCHVCNRQVYKKRQFVHTDCAGATELDGIVGVVKYSKPARKVIRAIKYGFAKEVAKELAPMLDLKLRVVGLRPDYVAPVPLFKNRQAWRGFNQAEILAQALNYPAFKLERVKETHTQVGFDREQRLQNLDQAFAVVPDEIRSLTARTVLLIDDVATTGSTLEECAKVVRSFGATKVYGLVWAREL